MKKMTKRLFLGCICTLLLHSAAHATPFIKLTQRAQEVQASGKYPLLDRVEPILKRMIKVRELPLKHPIEVDILNKKELLSELNRQVDTSLKPEELEGEKALYVRWKMIPEHFKYKEFLLNLYTEQIGGFYDSKTKKLYLIQGIPLSKLDMEALIAHELTHALQDQSYDLERLMNPPKDKKNDDQTLALMAVVEGDAVMASEEYIRLKAQEKTLSFLDILGSAVNLFRMNATFKKLNEAPGFIKNSLLFPYTTGRSFIAHFRHHEQWSWDDIGILYQTPPQSTEQILHPDKYLDGENPDQLTLPVRPQTLLTGTLGEMSWLEFFKAHLESTYEASEVAKGWQGDRFAVRRVKPGHYDLQALTHWDSPEDALEFAEAYERAFIKRFPKAKLQSKTQLQRQYAMENQETFILKRQGKSVEIYEGPDSP